MYFSLGETRKWGNTINSSAVHIKYKMLNGTILLSLTPGDNMEDTRGNQGLCLCRVILVWESDWFLMVRNWSVLCLRFLKGIKKQGGAGSKTEPWPVSGAQLGTWQCPMWSADLAVSSRSRYLSAQTSPLQPIKSNPLAETNMAYFSYELSTASQLLCSILVTVTKWHRTPLAGGNFCSNRKGFVGNRYSTAELIPWSSVAALSTCYEGKKSYPFLP